MVTVPQNVVFALSNAAAKGSTAARKAITALGLDRLPVAPDARRRGPRSSFQLRLQRWDTEQGLMADSRGSAGRSGGGSAGGRPGSAGSSAGGSSAAAAVMFSPREGLEGPQAGSSDGGVLGAVLLGVAGLASEPIRGLDEGESGPAASLLTRHCRPRPTSFAVLCWTHDPVPALQSGTRCHPSRPAQAACWACWQASSAAPSASWCCRWPACWKCLRERQTAYAAPWRAAATWAGCGRQGGQGGGGAGEQGGGGWRAEWAVAGSLRSHAGHSVRKALPGNSCSWASLRGPGAERTWA